MRRRALLFAGTGLALVTPAGASVELKGAVRRPLKLDATGLAAFPDAMHASFTLSRHIDGTERSSTVRGVRLFQVLERAELAERDRLDWRKAVVLATATDAYRTVFSWPELVNTQAGRQVLLAYQRDGVPLDAREGPIALHAPGDLRGGPRHVRNLVQLEVRVLRD